VVGLVLDAGSDGDGNMTGGFANLVGSSLGSGSEAFHGGPPIGEGLTDDEGGGIEADVVFGVGDGRSQDFEDRVTGPVGHEFEDDQGFPIGATADLVEYPSHFEGGHPDITGDRFNFVGGVDGHDG
jgi:hypothetical protein